MVKIKVSDKVIVTRGKDAGKTGEVISSLLPKQKGAKKMTDHKVVVAGVNMVTRHVKPNQLLNIQGGIVKVERPISASNVMLIDPKTSKPTRVGFKIDEKGNKVRFAKKSGEII